MIIGYVDPWGTYNPRPKTLNRHLNDHRHRLRDELEIYIGASRIRTGFGGYSDDKQPRNRPSDLARDR